jgi:hypothetical protein
MMEDGRWKMVDGGSWIVDRGIEDSRLSTIHHPPSTIYYLPSSSFKPSLTKQTPSQHSPLNAEGKIRLDFFCNSIMLAMMEI